MMAIGSDSRAEAAAATRGRRERRLAAALFSTAAGALGRTSTGAAKSVASLAECDRTK